MLLFLFQCRIAQDIFWRLNERGHIRKDRVHQLYCESCDRYIKKIFANILNLHKPFVDS